MIIELQGSLLCSLAGLSLTESITTRTIIYKQMIYHNIRILGSYGRYGRMKINESTDFEKYNLTN